MKSQIAFVGSMNMDISVSLHSLPSKGETKMGSSISEAPGGKSSNQAVAAALFGASPVLLAAVGDDSVGINVTDLANEKGVDVSHVARVTGQTTGKAFIFVDDDAENFIVVVPGANSTLQAESVVAKLEALSDHLAGLVLALEVPIGTALAASSFARDKGVVTFINPSPMTLDALTLIPMSDFLVVNEGEADKLAKLLDTPTFDLAIKLSRLGVRHLLVTRGPKGCRYFDLGNKHLTGVDFAAPSVKAVDTTGCGDAFLGTLAAAFIEKKDATSAIKSAIYAASFAALAKGAQSSYGARNDYESEFSNHSFYV